jgi:hypothetical protein
MAEAPRSSSRRRPQKAAAARRPAHHQSAAASEVVHKSTLKVGLPVVGQVELPPPRHLAWYVGVAALALLEVVDWPVALLLATGKALADNRHSTQLEDFGEALEEAG